MSAVQSERQESKNTLRKLKMSRSSDLAVTGPKATSAAAKSGKELKASNMEEDMTGTGGTW